MQSKLKVWVGAAAALFLGIPLSEKAFADSSFGGTGDIVQSALALAEAIVRVATEGS